MVSLKLFDIYSNSSLERTRFMRGKERGLKSYVWPLQGACFLSLLVEMHASYPQWLPGFLSTNYFKAIVSFGIDATAQVIVPCQWHIQLKQLWIGVLEGLLCLVLSYQSTKNNLRDLSADWFHCQVVWTCCTFPGFLGVFRLVPFTANDRRCLSSVWVYHAKKAYGSK